MTTETTIDNTNTTIKSPSVRGRKPKSTTQTVEPKIGDTSDLVNTSAEIPSAAIDLPAVSINASPNIETKAAVSPMEAIELGLITFPSYIPKDEYDQYIQQNGIDISCDRIDELDKDNFILLKNKVQKHRDRRSLPVEQFVVDGRDEPVNAFELMPSISYAFSSDFEINVKEGYVALLIVRSSLNRNAVLVTSGVWDTGFNGTVGGMVHNHGGITHIEVGARVAQVVFFRAEAAKHYNGSYQGV